MTVHAEPQISVVVPTHNRGSRLRTMLGAVAADRAASEIVVVLDGCGDASAEVVAGLAAEDPRFRAVDLHPNVGPAEARRRGVESATGTAVLCLDDDVLVAPVCVAGHARHHARGAGAVVVGYMPVIDDGRPGAVGRRYAGIYEDQAREWTDDPDSILRYLWGGNVSYPREAFLRAAGSCDRTLRFGEDQEMGLVLGQMGCRAFFDPGLRSRHLHHRSVEATRRDQVRAGDAYARLLARYPGCLPDGGEIFAAEHRSRLRRAVVETADRRSVRRAMTAGLEVLERRRPGTPAARLLLKVATRADFYRGFHQRSTSRVAPVPAEVSR